MSPRFLKWLCAAAAFLFLCALASVARADQIAHHGDNWVRITPLPCENPKVVDWLQKRGMDPARFKAGTAKLGVIFNLCYALDGDQVRLIYEDGDTGTVERGELESAPEA